MTDRHMRILRHLARHTQRQLDDSTPAPAMDTTSIGRREYLESAAKRTHGQVAAAEQRRQPSPAARKARP